MTMPSQDAHVPAELQDVHQTPPTWDEPAARMSLWGWMREGLRAGFFLKPRVGDAQPTVWQTLWLFLISQTLIILILRLQQPGKAEFHLQAWLGMLWTVPVNLWVGWAFLSANKHTDRVPTWFALACWAALPSMLMACSFSILSYRPDLLSTVLSRQQIVLANKVLIYAFWTLMVWQWAVGVGLSRAFLRGFRQLALFSVVSAALFVSALNWQGSNVWERDYSAESGTAAARPSLELTQELFETQQALWRKQVDALLPQRDGVADIYGLVFAPYGEEDVFMRESNLVREVLEERFDAKGRVLQLLNNPTTSNSVIWATPLNLERAVAALAAKMDLERDVLVVYLTSHGGQDHKLATSFWPLEMGPVTAEMLRDALDKAGVRHRVIAVSACYSGGWIEPLKNDDTLIMTAADALNTSYGCGSLSPLTYFGRAMFDEQLRSTHSFEKAFKAAVRIIRERELEVGKEDFSNPQISVGAKIGPLLAGIEQRMDALSASQQPKLPR